MQEQAGVTLCCICFLFDEAEFNQTGERVVGMVTRVAVGSINAGGGDQEATIDGDRSEPGGKVKQFPGLSVDWILKTELVETDAERENNFFQRRILNR